MIENLKQKTNIGDKKTAIIQMVGVLKKIKRKKKKLILNYNSRKNVIQKKIGNLRAHHIFHINSE